MESHYDLEDVIREADYIEAQRRVNQRCLFDTNGLIQTWMDRGTSIHIAYEMLGRWYVSDRSIPYHDLVIQELEQDMVPMDEVVDKRILIPHEYRFYAQKILSDLVEKVVKSAQKGSTGMQLINFLNNQQERLDTGQYRRPGEAWKD